MATPLPSPSLDDLIAFVSDEVTRQYERTHRRVNGVHLAERIRDRFPDLSYSALGVERLSDVVRVAEERKLLVRHRDVQHLEVSPANAPPSAPPQRRARGPTDMNHIPREIWEALVYLHPGQAYFLNRETSAVLAISEAESGTYATNPQYLQLPTIPADVQKSWMRDFIAERPEASEAAGAIESEVWFLEFFKQLRAVEAELATDWGKFRGRRVVEYVRKWAAENNLPLTKVLSSRPTAFSSPAPVSAPEASRSSGGQHGPEDETMRAAVLAILSEMSLDELLTLSLPLRRVVRHFRPR